jgi:sulfur carrier protein
VSIHRTEIIPFEPDAVRTAEGKSESLLLFSFLSFLFCACSFPEVIKNIGMNILINQQSRDIPDQCSLEHLLTQVLGIPVAGLAVAVHETVVPSTDWPAYILQPFDKVMLIRATQGG